MRINPNQPGTTPKGQLRINRRTCLKASFTASVMTLIEIRFNVASHAQDLSPSTLDLDAWVTLDSLNFAEIYFAKAEMGQGIWTTLPMILIEEIGLDPTKVSIRQAPSSPTYTSPAAGLSMTAGSTSVRIQFPILRNFGARARLRILSAASKALGSSIDDLEIKDSHIIDAASKTSHPISSFLNAIAKEPVPLEAPLKDPGQFFHLGRPYGELDAREKSFGKAQFGADIRIEGLLYAALIQNPSYGSKLINAQELESLNQELHFVAIDNGFAIVSRSFWSANQEAVRLAQFAQYEDLPSAQPFDNQLFESQLTSALSTLDIEEETGKKAEVRRKGDPEIEFEKSPVTIDALYSVPFLPHLCMETPTATAVTSHLSSEPDRVDTITVWAPTQSAFFVQSSLSEKYAIPLENITVHTTRLGGGFGRKAMTDYVLQAVAIANAVKKPVQLIWSREEDIRHDHYRPGFAARLRAGISNQGQSIALLADNCGPSISRSTGRPSQGFDPASIDGFFDDIYSLAHERVRHLEVQSPIPLGFWRSVGASQNTFFSECFIDEIAHAAGDDPLAFRMKHLNDDRLKQVLLALDLQTGWSISHGRPQQADRAWGLALYRGFGSYVGQIAEVSIGPRGRLIVHKIWCVVDTGLVLNPKGVEAQVQGSIAYALTAVLGLEAKFKNGRCIQNNFNDTYALPPQAMPDVLLTFVESNMPPGGMGEPATPPVAPAVANALFRLTNRRVRTLPIRL